MKIDKLISLVLLVLLLAFLHPELSILAQEKDVEESLDVDIEADRVFISPMISYQGRLVEDGLPVTGNRNMSFKLYETTGTIIIWSMPTTSVSVTNGLFNVNLGPFDQSTINDMDQELWLEINIGGTILPRQLLMGAPYAFTLVPGADISGDVSDAMLSTWNATGVGLAAHSENDYGLYGESVNEYGIVGVSSNDSGVMGESAAAHGVVGIGYGSGEPAAAIVASAEGSDGIALWTQSISTDSNIVARNYGLGPLFEGYGPEQSPTDPEFVIENTGNVKQSLNGYGLVKAGFVVFCDDTSSLLTSSFSNVFGVDPIAVDNSTSHGTGSCVVDVGFDLTGRFWSTTVPMPQASIPTCSHIGGELLQCNLTLYEGTPISGYIMVLIY